MNQFIKKAAIVAACVFALPAMNSFAAPITKPAGDGNKEIKASFAHDFRNAELMGTETNEKYTKVVFKMNDQVMTAFYSASGQLMAVTRNITSSQLPVSLLMNFKKHYSDCWISDLFEMSQDSESTYYLTVENSDVRTILRSNGDSWDVYSSIKK